MNIRSGKLPPVSVEAGTLGLSGGGATEVVPPKGTDASSELSEKKSYSEHTLIIDQKGTRNFPYLLYKRKQLVWLSSCSTGDRRRKVNSSLGHRGRNISDARRNF